MVPKTLMCKSQTFDQTVSNGWCLIWTGGVGTDSLYMVRHSPFLSWDWFFLAQINTYNYSWFPNHVIFTTHKNGKGEYIYIYHLYINIYSWWWLGDGANGMVLTCFNHIIVVYRLMTRTALPVAALAGKSPKQMGIQWHPYPICEPWCWYIYQQNWVILFG